MRCLCRRRYYSVSQSLFFMFGAVCFTGYYYLHRSCRRRTQNKGNGGRFVGDGGEDRGLGVALGEQLTDNLNYV